LGGEDAAVGPAGQAPDQPGVDRAEGEVGPGLDAALGQQPLHLRRREVRVEDQAGRPADEVEVARLPQLVAARRRAAVLPHQRPVQGPAGAAVPGDDRLPLVGDADGRHGLALALEPAHQLGERGHGGVPDVVGVVLDPAGVREVLGELAVGVAGRRAVGPQREAADPGRPRVDRDHHGHRGGTLRPRDTPAPLGRTVGSVAGMRVAMLTGGGDCPGLNAVMRAVARKGETVYGDEIVGLRDGWRGAVENDVVPLSVESFRGTLPRGGTILGSSRTNPYKIDGGPEAVKRTLADNAIDALIAIGGEDTLGVAAKLAAEGLAVVGVPKTIDNDLSATELTFGFDTAVQICVDAIDRLHTTAESHNRVMVVEVMGRHAGHIATWAGIAGGATVVLIPERPFDIDEVCEVIRRRHERGRYASIVVVAEGAVPVEGTMAVQSDEVDEFGHVRLGGIGDRLARAIEERTGYETRAIVLGHVQRGGTPTAF